MRNRDGPPIGTVLVGVAGVIGVFLVMLLGVQQYSRTVELLALIALFLALNFVF